MRNRRIFEIKSPIVLQPGPAALTNGLDAILAALSAEKCRGLNDEYRKSLCWHLQTG